MSKYWKAIIAALTAAFNKLRMVVAVKGVPVVCSSCNSTVTVKWSYIPEHGLEIIVTPCESCRQHAKDVNYELGYDDGYATGLHERPGDANAGCDPDNRID